MKRYLAITFILVLVFTLLGCEQSEVTFQDKVVFYYLRTDMQSDGTYGDSDTVIVPEIQDSLNPNRSMSYFIALYLNGPSDGRLHSPFPKNLVLHSVQRENSNLIITFSEELSLLSGIELTKACSCLALTCFHLTDANTVIIQTQTQSPENQIFFTISRDDLILEDLVKPDSNGG